MDFITRVQVDPRNTAEVGSMVHATSIDESREVLHFPPCNLSLLPEDKYTCYVQIESVFTIQNEETESP